MSHLAPCLRGMARDPQIVIQGNMEGLSSLSTLPLPPYFAFITLNPTSGESSDRDEVNMTYFYSLKCLLL